MGENIIKAWQINMRVAKGDQRREYIQCLGEIDKLFDDGAVTDDLLVERQQMLQKEIEIVKIDMLDCVQKSKIKWVVEGDENTKFFHGILKRTRKQMAINGVSIDKVWVTDPTVVKKEFYEYYEKIFRHLKKQISERQFGLAVVIELRVWMVLHSVS